MRCCSSSAPATAVGGPPQARAQLGVDHPVRHVGAVVPGADQTVELLAQVGSTWWVLGSAARDAPGAAGVVGLATAEQVLDLIGLQQSRQTEVVLLLGAARLRGETEVGAVEDHPVEVGLAAQRGEGALRQIRLGLGELGRGQQRRLVRVAARGEDVVALALHLGGEAEQQRHAGHEHRRGLAAGAGPDEAADRLGEEQRGRGGGGVDPDRQPGHVHALRDHPHRHHPALVATRRRR